MPQIKPKGNNQLNAKYTYVQRKHYEKYATGVVDDNPNLSLIDLRKKTLYGKVNLDLKIAVPHLSLMTPFQGTVNTFDFVADALEDFSAALLKRVESRAMRSSGPFAGLGLTSRSDTTWKSEYIAYLAKVKKKFKERKVDSPQSFNKIKSFRDFLLVFLEFATELNPTFPLTFGRYTLSSHNDIFATGLAFDINNEQYGDDYISCSQYFEDPNFSHFFQLAQNHGFILDRHAPWRFVVNLSSEATKEYMQKRGYLNSQDMFNKLYFNPLQAEFYEIVKMINMLYYEIFPPGSTTATICHSNGKTSYSLKPREVYNPNHFDSLDEMISMMGYPTWLRTYAFIKGVEINSAISQEQFDDIVKESISLNKYLDIESALGYINSKFDPLTVSTNKRSPRFRF